LDNRAFGAVTSLREQCPTKEAKQAVEMNGSSANESELNFEILHQSKRSGARVGRVHTPHGYVDTPGFVPVATNGAIKAVDIGQVDDQGVQLMFCNAYHLMLHPGPEIIEKAGGLHAFMGRRLDRPLITDSGGFQVFSLAYGTVHEELHSLKRGKRGASQHYPKKQNLVEGVSEDGVKFRSYRDGSLMLLTPESSVEAQKSLGADIILPLDELPPYHVTSHQLSSSLERSHRWAARGLAVHRADPRGQAMYGIVHGGSDLTLRRESARYISSLQFDGVAVGGALGASREELLTIMQAVVEVLPFHLPCHVLGIADPKSLPELIKLGCDTFDSCYATRVGRHGSIFNNDGTLLRVASQANQTAYRAPVEGCECSTCTTHTLAYLHHLVKTKEPVAASLLSLHNIHYMCKLMERFRNAILNDAM
jgi:queuine tRNA-ribosyltransferase